MAVATPFPKNNRGLDQWDLVRAGILSLVKASKQGKKHEKKQHEKNKMHSVCSLVCPSSSFTIHFIFFEFYILVSFFFYTLKYIYIFIIPVIFNFRF